MQKGFVVFNLNVLLPTKLILGLFLFHKFSHFTPTQQDDGVCVITGHEVGNSGYNGIDSIIIRVDVFVDKKEKEDSKWGGGRAVFVFVFHIFPLFSAPPPAVVMGCGTAEATGLGFVCFVVINPRVVSQQSCFFYCLFHIFPFLRSWCTFTPPPQCPLHMQHQ